MHIKQAFSTVGTDELPVRLVKAGSGNVKVARMMPVVEEFISRLRPDPRLMYCLVNAMGYSEFFGPNSNTDWYGYNEHLDFNGLLHSPDTCSDHGEFPNWQTDPVVQARLAKSWPFGYPSFYGATVFAHHKNDDPATLGFGDVILATKNDEMKRIELVERIDVDLAAKRGHSAFLDRIQRGDRVDVSMGCKVPFDLCSICTDWDAVKKAWKSFDPKRHSSPGLAILMYHRTKKPIQGLAVTKPDYCVHMTEQRGKILPDGRKVYVYNDFCKFFDISKVWVGADRTARVMWHLPADLGGKKERLKSLSEIMSKEASMTKIASAETLPQTSTKAAMDKEVTGGLARKIELCANSEVDMPFGELADFSKQFGAKTLLSTLGGLGIVVKPQEFHIIIGVHNPLHRTLSKMASERGMTFKTSLPGYQTHFDVDPALFSLKLAAKLEQYIGSRSSLAPHLHVRLGTMAKTASASAAQLIDTVFVHDVAAAYNGYRTSLVKESGRLLPKYSDVVPLSSSSLMKVSSSAGLLLSSPTVVHWLSAHLERGAEVEVELGVASKYVMQSPEFNKLGSLGEEVCARMNSNTNYMTALKTAARTAL